MRDLPTNVDVDAVIAVGQYLDDHSKTTPVSISDAIRVIRKRAKTRLSDFDLEQLIVESAGTRHLGLLLDTHDD
ncbi:hypothetical protein FJ930_27885 [Mesorhizobium sp. B2-4-15]|uniref:hypothetical protein n=1 Tax=unclassified Mesorhizobium TaxID=325217 RepID=UPI0011297F1B|nr:MULTISPECIES: hypothetical protein [unclassified Mesorhizobium]TPK61154.1 hypothetical protein FJ930_27885 [Mesorhizobium sp. B2-4-15]TPM17171.1 hypothetical protein FJ958_28620 [Mesorhizobium sp. B2-3-5]